MELKAGFTQSAPVKIMFNIGAGLDIPTGTYVKGKHGEHILNAGLGFLTGVVGIGNQFKSTLMHFMFLQALCRMFAAGPTGNTYDTEINIHEWHLKRMLEILGEYNGIDISHILDEGIWKITDKTIYHGDEYYDVLKDFMSDKRKNAGKITIKTPFLNREGTDYLEMLIPTFSEIDSFSEFSTQDVIKMQDENSLGESGANMVSMRQGMQKNRFLMEIPGLAGGSFNYTLMTAHIGSEFAMDPKNPPPKKLQYLKAGIKLKGVPEKFTFVMNNCWHCSNATPLINDGTKAPEYPRNQDDDLKGDTDLNVIKVINLRNKSGPTGIPLLLVVSQEEGVLPALTEFHHIKSADRYGLGGNIQNYYLELLPEVKLSRTVARGKIDTNPALRRALNITSEMCQINDLWHHVEQDFLGTPKALYDELKAQGYDWDMILTKTRGWWTPEGGSDLLFLSTWDLLRMREKTYHPYWLEDDKKTIKKAYRNAFNTPSEAPAAKAANKPAKTTSEEKMLIL